MNAEVPYETEPNAVEGGIPVFSEADAYTENYDQISKDHLDHLAATGKNPFIREELWTESEESTRELVIAHCPVGGRVLDVGVGSGRLLESLDQFDRFGMDISMGYLREARAKGIDVCYARIEDMPYAEESFDCVVCTDVLEHVVDLAVCSARILAVLKTGACLIVRVPNDEPLEIYLRGDVPYEYVHLRKFDEASLKIHFQKIFACEFVETRFAGRFAEAGYLRHPHLDENFAGRLMHFAELLDDRPDLRRQFCEFFFTPIEINCVFRKTTETAGSLGFQYVPPRGTAIA